jgi:hypothetical protein
MIDLVTEALLDQQRYDVLYEILVENPWDPNMFKNFTASQFGVKWRLANLATVDIDKFNQTVTKIVASSVEKAHAAGLQRGTFKGLATAAVAAAIVTIAYQGYKRFLSKAGRACNNKSGDEKTSCMNKYKRDALKRQISYLEKGLPSCDKTMEVYDCRDRVKRRIKKAKVKLGEL